MSRPLPALLLTLLSVSACRETGTAPVESQLEVSPTTLDFGRVGAGQQARRTLTLRLLRGSAAQLAWSAPPSPFTLLNAPEVVEGGTTTVEVSFTPNSAGPAQAWLEVSEGEGRKVHRIDLKGEGVSPQACEAGPCHEARWDVVKAECVRTLRADGTTCTSSCLEDALCRAGECIGRARSCDDGNACTTEACVEGQGCVSQALECPSPNPCQVGLCQPGKGCTVEPVLDGTPCGGGFATCDIANLCLSGQCKQVDPPDGTACELSPSTPCYTGQCAGSACVAVAARNADASCHGAPLCAGGGLPSPPAVPFEDDPHAFAVGDFSGDGLPDLAVATQSELIVKGDAGSRSLVQRRLLQLWLNEGHARFRPLAQLPLENVPVELLALDTDGDGRQELVGRAYAPGEGQVHLWRMRPGGLPLSPLTLDVGMGPVSGLQAQDLDGDGRMELLAWRAAANGAHLVRVDASGGPPTPLGVSLVSAPQGLAVGDIDTDGIADLVVLEASGMKLSYWKGLGGGAFAMTFQGGGFGSADELALGDADGDGVLDLLLVGPNTLVSRSVQLLKGDGRGGFAPLWSQGVGSTGLPFGVHFLPALANGGQPAWFADPSRLWRLHARPGGAPQLDGNMPVSALRDVAVADVDADGLMDALVLTPEAVHVYRGDADARLEGPEAIHAAPPATGAAVALVDVSGDARKDLVYLGMDGRDTVVVRMPATSNGFFGMTMPFASAPSGALQDVVDLDGDGVKELLLSQSLPFATLQVLEAYRTASVALTLPTLDTWFARGGDLNADGRMDLVLVTAQGRLVARLGSEPGTTNEAYSPGLEHPENLRDVLLVDVTGDGVLDVVATDYREGILHVARGQGDGLFVLEPARPTGYRPTRLASGDFDGDGRTDVMVGRLSGPPQLWRGRPGGLSQTPESLTQGSPTEQLLALDVNADGRLDVVSVHGPSLARLLEVLPGHGDGRFGAPTYFPTGEGPLWALAATDLDGDGRPEFVGLGQDAWNEGTVVLLRNHCESP